MMSLLTTPKEFAPETCCVPNGIPIHWTAAHSSEFMKLGLKEEELTEATYFALLREKYMPSAFASSSGAAGGKVGGTSTTTKPPVHVDALTLEEVIGHTHVDVSGVYDPVTKSVNFAKYMAVVHLLLRRGPAATKTYIHLVHPTARGHFPHPLFLLKLERGEVLVSEEEEEEEGGLFWLRPVDCPRCEMTLILEKDGRNLTKVMMAGIESNFNLLKEHKTVLEIGCKSEHIPAVLKHMKLTTAEQLIQAFKVAFVAEYEAFHNTAPSSKAVGNALAVIKELGGDPSVPEAGISAELAGLFTKVSGARDVTRLHKKLGRAVLANGRFFEVMGGTGFANYKTPFSSEELSQLGMNALVMAAITMLRVATDMKLLEMLLFDMTYNVVTVEGANHCDVKVGDEVLFGGHEVDTVWGKCGCPRDVMEPDRLVRLKGDKPMVGTLGNGLMLFRMAWENMEQQQEQLAAVLGLKKPVTVDDAEASAALVLDRIFDVVYAKANQ